MSAAARTAAEPSATSRPGAGRGFRRYVAIGDSLSAGSPEAATRWPDELAALLRAHEPALEYHNLAIAGVTGAAVRDAQLDRAIELAPDLVTAVCGMNDVIEQMGRADAAGDALDAIFARLRARLPAATVVTATYPDPTPHLATTPRVREQLSAGLAALNAAIRAAASRHEVGCLDVATHRGGDDRANFAGDGLHPSTLGHIAMAEAAADLLRLPHTDPKEHS